jgi:hypothetical protein
MDTVRTQKELDEIATAAAVDVGCEAIGWWLDEAKPHRLRVHARPRLGSPSITLILLATLPEAASGE